MIMNSISHRLSGYSRHHRWTLPAACLMRFAGCAQIPALDKSVEAKPVEQLRGSDPQLNRIVDEALRVSKSHHSIQFNLKD